MERAPNPREARTNRHIAARCVTDWSGSFPRHYEMFCPLFAISNFLAFSATHFPYPNAE